MKNNTADFESIMALAAIDSLSGRNAPTQPRRYKRYVAVRGTGRRNRIGNFGIFMAISVFTSVVFVAGLLPGNVDQPQMWTHAFIALTIAQFAMLAGATLKASSRQVRPIRDADIPARQSSGDIEIGEMAAAAEERLPLPVVALSSGLMGDRAYIAFSDGSIEVDTMLGRRRFPDFQAAREFVGG